MLNDTEISRRVFVDAGSLVDRIRWAVVYVAMPMVGVFGVTGNSLSLVVLYRQGFKKSSNILLFTLACSDILFVIGANGLAQYMTHYGRIGLWYPDNNARLLYNFYHFFEFLNWCAGPMSMGIPVLITGERFIAVFFPLKFNTIVTARRTFITLVVLAIFIYILPQVYVRFLFRLSYVYDPASNATMGVAVRTDLYFEQEYLSRLIGEWYAATGYAVAVVGSGTLAIGIRISLAAAQRRRMVTGDGSKKKNVSKHGGAGDGQGQGQKGLTTSKTTKTLLALCCFYTISCLFVAMPTIFPSICVWPLFTLDPNFRSIEVFVYHLINLDLCINASCNFVIYVVMNKNFRNTFLEIFRRRTNE